MYKLRFVLLALMLMVSSCSTVNAIFGPAEPDVTSASNKDQLAQENEQLGSEIADLRNSLKQLNQDIVDQKAQKLAQLKAGEEARPQAKQAIPKDRLWVTVSFRSGYMELTRQSRQALKRLAEKFLSKPRMQQIEIRGYTDDEPIGGYPGHRHKSRHPYKTNLALSQARSQNVADALVAYGLPQEIVRAEGFGATSFVADNTTDAGRQRNRRSEIHLVSK